MSVEMVALASRTAPAPAQPSLRKRLEQHLHELPVLPTVVVELMHLRPEDAHYFDDVRKLIELDPAFSARILAAANSAASSPRRPIVTVRDALQRLGSTQAASLLLTSAVTRVFVPRDDWEKALWRHSLEVAVLARAVAHHTGVADAEHAYTCGLLHDLGRFILFQEAPEQLRRVEEASWSTAVELLAAEREICGLTHSELGALACRKWRLPEAIAQVVGDHHVPHRSGSPLTAIVAMADELMFGSVRADTNDGREHGRADGASSGAASPREPSPSQSSASNPAIAELVASPEALEALLASARAEATVSARVLGVEAR